MAQYRQSGTERFSGRVGSYPHYANNGAVSSSSSDHIAIGIRNGVGGASGGGASQHGKNNRWRRSVRPDKIRRLGIGSVVFVLCVVLVITVLAYYYISGFTNSGYDDKGFDSYDGDFLTNVTRIDPAKVLEFGQGSVVHGRDSRYWDKDDRRRDDDYNEDEVEHKSEVDEDRSVAEVKKDPVKGSSDLKGIGLYNEAGRNELKKYEAEYQASLVKGGESTKENSANHEAVNMDPEDDDAIDSHDSQGDEYVDSGHDEDDNEEMHKDKLTEEVLYSVTKQHNMENDDGAISKRSLGDSSLVSKGGKSGKSSRSDTKRRGRGRRSSGASCEMKLLNSSQQIVEPLNTRKSARFSLQYIENEDKPDGEEQWEPRFAGHQSLEDREKSFLVQDKKIHCGFVKNPKGSPSTGFDLTEDDTNYISRCHIAVISCIFGNSDRLRPPANKMISRLSRKNVCFIVFVDEITMQTLSAEGHAPDRAGFIGLWKLVVVKNLPYADMRRVGKIPKLLPHRLFPSARYSIWLDSKLRLQLDPLLILEYFLWRKGHEYAISNHYDRHCLWEEVAQNKKLNKYNHTVIDQQFEFYKADGLTRFNASDPFKLLPSNVPEGSFIVRAHTPMSNLFSCLWFNEVERFTPRDQLSFAYTYQKLRRMNPDKPFNLHMFKDCERRKIAKLFRHRSEEKRNLIQAALQQQ
uniref:TOD1/MUCI70 glycosyltransferase-like domain-containing protein n=1 Tax=Noccaea caerulescens TaxID=107243 RepID=A0A1J3CM33_NOCCA